MGWINLRFPATCACGVRLQAGARANFQGAGKFSQCGHCTGTQPSSEQRATPAASRAPYRAQTPVLSAEQTEANYIALHARLDPDQKIVASWRPEAGNVRVVAAAGSGKSTTLVALVARLVREGMLRADEIVATTFTSKAGAELGARLAEVIPAGSFAALRVGTFHGLALRALREQLPGKFAMARCLDANDRTRDRAIPATGLLWHKILGFYDLPGLPYGEKGLDLGEDAKGKDYSMAVDVIRSRCISFGSLAAKEAAREAGQKKGLGKLYEAWTLYERCKHGLGAWDFADALATYHAGLGDGSVRDGAKLVIVDEAQDNSQIQIEIAERLGQGGNVILIGDARQAIFEWRGAAPQLFAQADERLGAATLQIRYNYRSGAKIVALANRIAEGQSWTIGDASKPGRRDNAEGVVRIQGGYADPADEAEVIAAEIKASVVEEKSETADGYAILARTNAQNGLVEAALVEAGIPCVVVGGTPFFARKEMQDALAYCKLASRDDVEALRRVANRPSRYLGAAFLRDVEAAFPGHGSLIAAIDAVATGLNSRSKVGAKQLSATLAQLRTAGWPKAAEMVVDLLAPPVEGKENGTDEDKRGTFASFATIAARFASVDALAAFAARCLGEVQSIVGEVALDDLPKGRVVVSTVHRVKGLEARRVYVLATATLFPHSRSVGDENRMAEERRLWYVACTRAKDSLTLTWAETNLRGKPAGPSEFLDYVEPEAGPDDDGPQGGDKSGTATEVVGIQPSFHPTSVAAPAERPLAALPEVEDAFEQARQAQPPQDSSPEVPAALPAAYAYAEQESARTVPSAAGGGRFVEVEAGQFEALLSPLGFVHAAKAVERKAGQQVYERDLGRGIFVLVYTTVPTAAAEARGCGDDSIKVSLVLRDLDHERPLMKRQPHCTRTRGWRVQLLKRIEEALHKVVASPACRKCGGPTVLRENKEGTNFYGCASYPICKT